MEWETVIGLEVHVELSTRTKIFCACSTEFGGETNTHCCPVCIGMPGTLPVVNKKVVEYAVRVGLALNCNIARRCKFDRKNYFYPDLPKAYQISQLYLPLCRNGCVRIGTSEGEKDIRIHEIHMEEDAGKLIHDRVDGLTLCDYNRSGVPLIEIVTEADFRSGEEVIAFLEKLKSILEYLEVSDCKMQEGSMRVDVNLSVRPKGSDELGIRTEMKNIGSFRGIMRAIEYESKRQISVIESGGKVIQETRRWDEGRNETLSMRSKEDAGDYRYFPEPDIPPLELEEKYLGKLKSSLPELADKKQRRYVNELGIPPYDAKMMTSQKALADFFEKTVALGVPAKEVSNWIMSHTLRLMKEKSIEARELKMHPETLGQIIRMVGNGRINRPTAVSVFEAMFENGGDAVEYVKLNALEQVSDADTVMSAVENVLLSNPQAITDYRAGKTKAVGFVVGQVMRELKGKAAPDIVNKLVKEALEK